MNLSSMPDPRKGFGWQGLPPHHSAKHPTGFAPVWHAVVTPSLGPLSLSNFFLSSMFSFLWLHQLYNTLTRIFVLRTENLRKNNISASPRAMMALRNGPSVPQFTRAPPWEVPTQDSLPFKSPRSVRTNLPRSIRTNLPEKYLALSNTGTQTEGSWKI